MQVKVILLYIFPPLSRLHTQLLLACYGKTYGPIELIRAVLVY